VKWIHLRQGSPTFFFRWAALGLASAGGGPIKENAIKSFIKVWALQKYTIQELVRQCDVRRCLADTISSTFGSNLVVPIIKVDFKCPCDTKVRYLIVTYFWNSVTPKKR
jgi:hypothetical protein